MQICYHAGYVTMQDMLPCRYVTVQICYHAGRVTMQICYHAGRVTMQVPCRYVTMRVQRLHEDLCKTWTHILESRTYINPSMLRV